MADEEIGIVQEVFDKALAEGKSEREARALAKSAWVRKTRGKAGPGEKKAAAAEAAAPEAAPAETAPAGAAPAAASGAPTATAVQERLTPEQRAARVAAATGRTATTNGGGGRGTGAGETHRLLAVVPPEGIQRTVKRQDDKVNVWPHLLAAELLSLLVCMVFLLVFSTFKDAPFRELANPSLTPNPSKAPWYFLGLQELLRYFHPMVAGVTIPGLGLFALMALPYADKNPSMKPERRKLAVIIFTIFMMFWCVLVILGVLFRGPGYNFIWPWNSGVFFDL
ncbi:MAG TPA: menaquinol-cytochrome c reductase cytochrome b subunit [Actinomycetota bacterium]